MIAVGVRYLCGWSVASDVSDRLLPEWPPHPRRVFLALAAAHFETGADPAKREALEWLEALPPPAIRASDAFPRRVVTTFVPVNDTCSPINKKGRALPTLASLPFGRARQPRTFAVAIPHEEVVHLSWSCSAQDADRYGGALEALCETVTCVGHSASLVQMWTSGEQIEPTLVPTSENATKRLRVPGPGLLRELETRHLKGQRPLPGLFVGYAPPSGMPDEAPEGSIFSPEIVVLRKTSGPPLALEAALGVTSLLRKAAMSAGPQPSPEYLCGHESDGERSHLPHVAFLGLPDVGHPYADGHLMGVAAALPLSLQPEERRACYRALAAVDRLHLGSLGEWRLESLDPEAAPPRALLASTWTGPSRRWASVTPVVLDRFPKRAGDAELVVQRACQHVGCAKPTRITVASASIVSGVPLASEFPPLPSVSSRPRRWHQHVVVEFPNPIRGPLLLGAGRYRGYGLMRPVPERT